MPRIAPRARQSTGRPRRIGETPVPTPAAGERSRCWQCCWTPLELSAFSIERPPGCSLSLDADDFKEGPRGSAIDLVGEDTQSERLVDGLVKASEQLKQAFTTTTNQHGVGAIFIRGGGDTTHRAQHAEGDVAVLDQLGDIGKRQGGHRNLSL